MKNKFLVNVYVIKLDKKFDIYIPIDLKVGEIAKLICKATNLLAENQLKTGEKYYISDIAMRNMLIGQKPQDYGHVLENIVYLELLRRGYQVFVGKVGDLEVDFTAIKGQDVEHYQVAWTAIEEKTLKRELQSLEQINDHNPKFLLTMDYIPVTSHNGIKQINVLDWLLA